MSVPRVGQTEQPTNPPSLLAREFHDNLKGLMGLLSSPQMDLDQIKEAVIKLDGLSKEAIQC